MAEATPPPKPSTGEHRRGVKKKKYSSQDKEKIMKMIKEGAKNMDMLESTIRSMNRHPNVQVVFLPANTTSIIQPLHQEIIANIKLMYYRDLYYDIDRKTDTNVELRQIEGEDQERNGEEDQERNGEED